MLREFRYGVRMLLRSPGFAITAILTLGLAIGANTAVFALLDAVLLKPLPYPQPERLALLSRVSSRGGVRFSEDIAHTGAVWESLRDHASSVDVAASSGLSARISLAAGDRAISAWRRSG